MALCLLIEAVASPQGTEGLASLAGEGGPHSGWLHLAWFDAAREKGGLEDARRAAVEGMAGRSGPGDRATLAERLAELGEQVGDDVTAVEARRTAWTSAPTLERLLALVHAARRGGVVAGTLAALGEDALSPPGCRGCACHWRAVPPCSCSPVASATPSP